MGQARPPLFPNDCSRSAAQQRDAHRLLAAIYGDEPPGHRVVFTSIGERPNAKTSTRWFPANDPDAAIARATEQSPATNVYVGMALQDRAAAIAEAQRLENARAERARPPRRPGTVTDLGTRGFSKTAIAIGCVWADIDFRTTGAHAEQRLPSEAEALAFIRDFPIPCSALVRSGHGFYPLWLLNELWRFDTPAESREAQTFLHRMQATVNERARARGWKLDSTGDLARVLRLPGTLNHKIPVQLVPVQLVELDEARRYNPDDVEPYLIDQNVRQWVGTNYTARDPEEWPLVNLEPVEKGCAWLRHCRDDAADLSEPEWHAMLTVLACVKGGPEVAHEWSAPHSGYSPEATDEKFDHARNDSGPMKCATILAHRGGAGYCETCEHGKLDSSPVTLAYPSFNFHVDPDGSASPADDPPDAAAGPEPGADDGAPTDAPGPGPDAPKDSGTDTITAIRERIRSAPDPIVVFAQIATEPETLGALAVAAIRQPAFLQTLKLELLGLKVKPFAINAFFKAIDTEVRRRQNFRVVPPTERPSPVRVKSVLPDAPVPDEAEVPEGWTLSRAGVLKPQAGQDGEPGIPAVIARQPVVIAGRLRDVATDDEKLRLAFHADGHWHHRTVSRAIAANSRELIALAGSGYPVTSGTAGPQVEYLADFEATNANSLPRAHVASQFGWQGERGKLGFLIGRRLIAPDGSMPGELDIEAMAPEDWREDFVAFHGADAGDNQFADAYQAAGTLDAWIEQAAIAATYPRVLLALYTACVPPLQGILGIPNFGMDFAYPTSTGKSTTLRFAASAWGNPDDRAPASALGTWDATRVWIERASTVLNGIPLILDDTKRAKNPRLIAQTIYDVVQGRGRGRGSPNGMRRLGTWSTVLLSSGESRAVDFTEDGGTRARMLTIWGSPFGKTDAATGARVLRINQGVLLNYGHVGPRLVAFLLRHRDRWERGREQYAKAQCEALERAGDNPIAGRIAAYFAAIEMAAKLVHQAIPELPWKFEDQLDGIWRALTAEAIESDRATVALDRVYAWAVGHQTQFWGRHEVDREGYPRLSAAGLAGYWERSPDWEFVGFITTQLHRVLAEMDYEPESIMRIWRDRRWLVVDHQGKSPRVRLGNESARVRVVALKRTEIEAASDIGTGEDFYV